MFAQNLNYPETSTNFDIKYSYNKQCYIVHLSEFKERVDS